MPAKRPVRSCVRVLTVHIPTVKSPRELTTNSQITTPAKVKNVGITSPKL
jgi:hypothetical protein